MGSLLDFLGRNTALERTYVTFTSPASLPPRLMAVILVLNIQGKYLFYMLSHLKAT